MAKCNKYHITLTLYFVSNIDFNLIIFIQSLSPNNLDNFLVRDIWIMIKNLE